MHAPEAKYFPPSQGATQLTGWEAFNHDVVQQTARIVVYVSLSAWLVSLR